jgi:ATP-dependent Zn protease
MIPDTAGPPSAGYDVNQGTREETAHHEAGHQVAARVLGASLGQVSIVKNEAENSRGECDQPRWPGTVDDEWEDRAEIIVDFAGLAAAAKLTRRFNRVGSYNDERHAEMVAGFVSSEPRAILLNGSWSFAQQVIEENRAGVVALATVLLEREELDGPEGGGDHRRGPGEPAGRVR